MRCALPLVCLLLAFGVAACAGPKGSFPSLSPRAAEMERVIAAPGADSVPALSPEQQASFRADLARERALLAAAEEEVAATSAALDQALRAARGQPTGSEGWSRAQMALSRLDQARSPLDGIAARLAPLARTADSLPATDPDRQALEALSARAEAAAAAAQRQVESANRQLGT
jgi:hypothetical protein